MNQRDDNVQPFESIDERDLHAYVDGLLEPERARKVQDYLKRHPDKAQQVNDYAEYNEVLREAFERQAAEPVPRRLLAILERPPSPVWPAFAKFAALGVLCVMSAGGGWLAAYKSGAVVPSGESLTQNFLQQIALNASAPFEAMPVEKLNIHAPVQTDPLNWLTQKVALEMEAPDLTAAGYTMQSRRLISEGAQEFVELTYVNSSGDAVRLYLKTRWEKDAPTLEFVQQNQQSIAFWEEGPLVYALSGALDRERAVKIAELVRNSMTTVSPNPPQVQNIEVAPINPSGQVQASHGYPVQEPSIQPQPSVN